MIKKLLLITGLMLSTSLWASPMDNVCHLTVGEGAEKIYECERNNILVLKEIPLDVVQTMITNWCRFDRQINTSKSEANELGIEHVNISCVMYDNEPRKSVTVKYN